MEKKFISHKTRTKQIMKWFTMRQTNLLLTKIMIAKKEWSMTQQATINLILNKIMDKNKTNTVSRVIIINHISPVNDKETTNIIHCEIKQTILVDKEILINLSCRLTLNLMISMNKIKMQVIQLQMQGLAHT